MRPKIKEGKTDRDLYHSGDMWIIIIPAAAYDIAPYIMDDGNNVCLCQSSASREARMRSKKLQGQRECFRSKVDARAFGTDRKSTEDQERAGEFTGGTLPMGNAHLSRP